METSATWSHVDQTPAPKDQTIFVWDEVLQTVVKNVSWFGGDINQFGTSNQQWSGQFKFWMPVTDNIDAIDDPYFERTFLGYCGLQ